MGIFFSSWWSELVAKESVPFPRLLVALPNFLSPRRRRQYQLDSTDALNTEQFMLRNDNIKAIGSAMLHLSHLAAARDYCLVTHSAIGFAVSHRGQGPSPIHLFHFLISKSMLSSSHFR
jgi:hypothetical protein